ncbi:MAG: TolC family outer membrane protein [Cloacibacillus sp.]
MFVTVKKIALFLGVFSAAALVLSCPVLAAAEGLSVQESIQRAVDTNPEAQAKLHAFRASLRDWQAAFGGYRPKLDAYAGIGRENLDGEGYNGSDLFDYTRDGASLILTQPIYDGNLTRSQVRRYEYAKNMRYFDLSAKLEEVAYAGFRCHQDVIRYRKAVAMARNNVARHEELLAKVKKRAIAGVDSKVNLETAMGRLALAKVNCLTEESNLHDTITQYVRVTGTEPAEQMEEAVIEVTLPEQPEACVTEALTGNPQVASYKENTNSMRHAIQEQASRMRPKLDFRAGVNLDHDTDGNKGRRDKSWVELMFRYNLYNGGIDKANIKKSEEQYQESEEVFKKIERDVRQAVLIAYNDVKNIELQIPNLEEHKKAAQVMRTAYVKQFEAGRRTLLDVLDAENESFQSELAYVNALYNLSSMKADYLTSVGRLLSYYDIKKVEMPEPQKAGIDMDRIVRELGNKD